MCSYVVKATYPSEAIDRGTVTFLLNTGVKLEYFISMTETKVFLHCTSGQFNDEIFKALHIKSKYTFIEKIVGYTPELGVFPLVKVCDIIKVIKGLEDYRPYSVNPKEGDSTQSNQKFTLSVKKHKQTKLNFKL